MSDTERIPTVDPETVAALEAMADGRGNVETFRLSRAGEGQPYRETGIGHGATLDEARYGATFDERIARLEAQLDRMERMLRHTMYLVSVLAKIARVTTDELQAAHEVALQAERGTTGADDAEG